MPECNVKVPLLVVDQNRYAAHVKYSTDRPITWVNESVSVWIGTHAGEQLIYEKGLPADIEEIQSFELPSVPDGIYAHVSLWDDGRVKCDAYKDARYINPTWVTEDLAMTTHIEKEKGADVFHYFIKVLSATERDIHPNVQMKRLAGLPILGGLRPQITCEQCYRNPTGIKDTESGCCTNLWTHSNYKMRPFRYHAWTGTWEFQRYSDHGKWKYRVWIVEAKTARADDVLYENMNAGTVKIGVTGGKTLVTQSSRHPIGGE